MVPHPGHPREGESRSPWPLLALALVLLAGLGLRAMVNLAPACLPGDDAAYYFVQVRGILRGQGLPFPDFPLLFYLQAGVALLLSAFMDAPRAIVASVTALDTVLPLLLALPVFLFAKEFAPERPGRAALAVLLVGTLAVASGNVLTMAGGMIKNGAALPFCLLYAHQLHRGFRDPSRRSFLLAGLAFLASSLIHISALVVNATFTLVLAAAACSRHQLRHGALAVIGMLVPIALLPILDPDHGARLHGLLAHPAQAFSSQPWTAWEQPAPWLGNLLGALGVLALWRHRGRLGPGEGRLLAAATCTTFALSFPFLRPDLLERLALVAIVPGMIPALFLVCRDPAGSWLVAPLAVAGTLHGWAAVKTLRLTGLQAPAWTELAGFKQVIPPGRGMVIVPHGPNWWVAWALDLHFSHRAARALVDRKAYAAVYLLEECGPGAFGRLPAVLGNPPGSSIEDRERLCGLEFTVLQEGAYFRLSRLEDPPAAPATQPDPAH